MTSGVTGEEVARLLVPIPVQGLDRLSDYLQEACGEGLVMEQEGSHMIVRRPAPDLGTAALAELMPLEPVWCVTQRGYYCQPGSDREPGVRPDNEHER